MADLLPRVYATGRNARISVGRGRCAVHRPRLTGRLSTDFRPRRSIRPVDPQTPGVNLVRRRSSPCCWPAGRRPVAACLRPPRRRPSPACRDRRAGRWPGRRRSSAASTRPTTPTDRVTAGSTWPPRPASAGAGGGRRAPWPSPGSVAGRGVVSIDHGACRTTYEPVTPRGPGRPAGGARRADRPGGRRRPLCRPLSALGPAARSQTYLDPLAADHDPGQRTAAAAGRRPPGGGGGAGPGARGGGSEAAEPGLGGTAAAFGAVGPGGRHGFRPPGAGSDHLRIRRCGSTRCCGAGSCTTAPTSARPAAPRSEPRTPARSLRRPTAAATGTGCCSATGRSTGTP